MFDVLHVGNIYISVEITHALICETVFHKTDNPTPFEVDDFTERFQSFNQWNIIFQVSFRKICKTCSSFNLVDVGGSYSTYHNMYMFGKKFL